MNTKNVRQGFFDFSETAFIDEDRHRALGGGVLRRNDIVLTIRGTLGNTAIYNADVPFEVVRINSAMLIVRPKVGFEPRFIEHYLRSSHFTDWASVNQRGSAQPHLRTADIETAQIPLVSPAEQRRIVAKLDALTARLASARAELDRVQTLAQSFRSRAIRSGFSGQLTADWRSRDTHNRASSDLPSGWNTVPLGEIADVKSGVTLGKKRDPKVELTSLPYLRVANVQRGKLQLSIMKSVEVTLKEASALMLRPGDILMNEGGDRDKLGRGWIWNGEIDNCIHQNHVFRVRLKDCANSPAYVSHFANEFGQEYFLEHGTQTTNLASVSKAKVSALPIPLAPPSEQQEIIRRLEAAFARADRLEAEAARARALLDRLEAAILAKAFRGELVPQDPADEPASVLLDRIRAERAAAPTPKRGRRSNAPQV